MCETILDRTLVIKSMKRDLLCLPLNLVAVLGLLLGVGILISASASAQNLLQNGDFAQPLGPTNWTIGYLHGGPDDFDIKDRTSGGHATFRPVGTIRLRLSTAVKAP